MLDNKKHNMIMISISIASIYLLAVDICHVIGNRIGKLGDFKIMRLYSRFFYRYMRVKLAISLGLIQINLLILGLSFVT